MDTSQEITDDSLSKIIESILHYPVNQNLTGDFSQDERIELSDSYYEEEQLGIDSLYYDSDVYDFKLTDEVCPMCAVDVGATKIGETSDGAVVAYRGCIVYNHGSEKKNFLFRTGPILLRNTLTYKNDILFKIGKFLGDPGRFVKLDETNQPIKPKPGAADTQNQYSDRLRNAIERYLQVKAVSMIQNGIILIDGALTMNTRDTPAEFVKTNIIDSAFANDNRVIAISKKSSLLVDNRPIRFSLDEYPNRICYRNIQYNLDEKYRDINFGQMYAARFSEYGPTFRMDVCVPEGEDIRDIMSVFYSNSLIRNGYPDLLVRAHLHTYIPWSYLVSMKAKAIADYNIHVVNDLDFSGAFAPFGGGFK